MSPALAAGAGIGAGLWLLIAALAPARPTIGGQLDRLATASWTAPPKLSGELAGGWWPRLQLRLGRPLAAAAAGRGALGPGPRADLAVTGRTPELLYAGKALAALAGLAAPVLLAGLLAAGGAPVPALVPAWVSLCAAAAGFLLPDVGLRRAAASSRRAWRAATAAYLDLVAMRMASGAGLSEAVTDAARIGDGPAFRALRGALADARTDQLTVAGALARLGTELALPDLAEVGARLALVEGSGAQAQTSLRAHAATLRDRERTDTQGRAAERSQSMLVAQIVLGLGFVIFLGYPAVAKVLAT